MITSLGGARNPHVLACTLRFLRSVRLVLTVLTTINRGAHVSLPFITAILDDCLITTCIKTRYKYSSRDRKEEKR